MLPFPELTRTPRTHAQLPPDFLGPKVDAAAQGTSAATIRWCPRYRPLDRVLFFFSTPSPPCIRRRRPRHGCRSCQSAGIWRSRARLVRIRVWSVHAQIRSRLDCLRRDRRGAPSARVHKKTAKAAATLTHDPPLLSSLLLAHSRALLYSYLYAWPSSSSTSCSCRPSMTLLVTSTLLSVRVCNVTFTSTFGSFYLAILASSDRRGVGRAIGVAHPRWTSRACCPAGSRSAASGCVRSSKGRRIAHLIAIWYRFMKKRMKKLYRELIPPCPALASCPEPTC